jgi:hypothetical protein
MRRVYHLRGCSGSGQVPGLVSSRPEKRAVRPANHRAALLLGGINGCPSHVYDTMRHQAYLHRVFSHSFLTAEYGLTRTCLRQRVGREQIVPRFDAGRMLSIEVVRR